jgi:hypothetical protein
MAGRKVSPDTQPKIDFLFDFWAAHSAAPQTAALNAVKDKFGTQLDTTLVRLLRMKFDRTNGARFKFLGKKALENELGPLPTRGGRGRAAKSAGNKPRAAAKGTGRPGRRPDPATQRKIDHLGVLWTANPNLTQSAAASAVKAKFGTSLDAHVVSSAHRLHQKGKLKGFVYEGKKAMTELVGGSSGGERRGRRAGGGRGPIRFDAPIRTRTPGSTMGRRQSDIEKSRLKLAHIARPNCIVTVTEGERFETHSFRNPVDARRAIEELLESGVSPESLADYVKEPVQFERTFRVQLVSEV